jgi:hypothetical protein
VLVGSALVGAGCCGTNVGELLGVGSSAVGDSCSARKPDHVSAKIRAGSVPP